jgi:hypothetical protein
MNSIKSVPVGAMLVIVWWFSVATFSGCTDSEGPLLPYAGGGRVLSTLTIEAGTFTPQITWLGGYSTVLGVNRGTRAVLDSTLVWLVNQSGNALRFPSRVGSLPAGAANLTTTFGGVPVARLTEDQEYTFWIMKDEAWAQVQQRPHKVIVVDSLAATMVTERHDTVFVAASQFSSATIRLDLYINIRNLATFGRLGVLGVTQSDTTNRLEVTLQITQSGVTDSLLSAIGITNGNAYDINDIKWELISEDASVTPPVYFKNNVIRLPLRMGTSVAGAHTFTAYPASGLTRGKQYYLWVANKSWDGQARTRSTANYAFAIFDVW